MLLGHCYFALMHTLFPTKEMAYLARKAAPLASLWDAVRFRSEKQVVLSLRSSTSGMINRSIPTTTFGDSPTQLNGKPPIDLVKHGVARTGKLDLTA